MSTEAAQYIVVQKAAKDLRKLLESDPELLNRFNAEFEQANSKEYNTENVNIIIEKFNKEYENKKKEKNYKSLLDRLLAKGGKKRRQKKTKKSRKQRKTRKLRKTRARK
jgi:hypothetical protein